MFPLTIFQILQILIIIYTPSVLSYPSQLYGNKRYGRSRVPSYDPYDTYLRAGHPVNYYTLFPSYGQNLPDDVYYSQEGYPAIFYPRTSKYEVYQAVLPYYQDLPLTRAKYYNDYYEYEPNPQEKLLQDIEIEQREEAQPIGHEIRYEGDYNGDQNIDEINRAFVKNLMAMDDSNPEQFYDQSPYEYSDFGDTTSIPKWNDVPYDRSVINPVSVQTNEDVDVKELKQLTQTKQEGKSKQNKKQRKQRQRKQKNTNKNNEDIHWFKEPEFNERKRDLFDNTVSYNDRKPISVKTEQPTIGTTISPSKEQEGQKEEVMMRPATPVRHPLSDSVLDMMASQKERERKRVPSVYDTIKKMLEMEKYEEDQQSGVSEKEVYPSMKKRIVSNEDSLIKQLTVLKKNH